MEEEPGAQVGKQTYLHSSSRSVSMPIFTPILTLNALGFPLCFSCFLPDAWNPTGRKFKQDNLTEKCYLDIHKDS